MNIVRCPKPLKEGSKNAKRPFPSNTAFRLKKVYYKVVSDKVVRLVACLSVHGRRSRGEVRGNKSSPQNLERGIVPPPDFVTLQHFKHQITCITM